MNAPLAVDDVEPPVRWREPFAVALLVVLSDVVMYRGTGFSGYSLFMFVAPALLALGTPRLRAGRSVWIVGGMLAVLAAKLVWSGSEPLILVGAALLVAFAMAARGVTPFVLGAIIYALRSTVSGGVGVCRFVAFYAQGVPVPPRTVWMRVALPLAAVSGFGAIFVMANPDVVTTVAHWLRELDRAIGDLVASFAPSAAEVALWFGVAWMASGLLRPMLHPATPPAAAPEGEAGGVPTAPLALRYSVPFRNTLLAVIGLFAVYLAFEFQTLWFREFPPGFYYSGYAHEGAAWLTAALALATAVLSAMFHRCPPAEAATASLRRLAWVWSIENLLLGLAVYHRLSIYVGFNGMTRMRTVGLLGVSAVVVGFALVIWKIHRGRDFTWLVRRQLWTVALAVYLLGVLPVDWLVHGYNTRRILAGDPAPSVEISVHESSAGGYLGIVPLMDCDDAIIRDGVRAMLAEESLTLDERRRKPGAKHWSAFQLADHLLAERLNQSRAKWQEFLSPSARARALARFHDYAYQWY